MVKYRIALTKAEHDELMAIIDKGHHSSQTFRTAYVLLNCDEGKYSQKVTNEQMSKVLKIGMRTIDRIKKKFVEEGFEASLERRPTSRQYDRIADGETEAHLIALSCSKPPTGYGKWSLRLLADRMVELNYVEDISYETVRRILKKTNLNRGKLKSG
jgi:transposase